MQNDQFWNCNCPREMPFVHHISQADCIFCGVLQQQQPRSDEEDVHKFGVIPALGEKVFIWRERFQEPSTGPFTREDWEVNRFIALRAADIASQKNRVSLDRTEKFRNSTCYSMVRCLNLAPNPSGGQYEKICDENDEYFVKTYQPIVKIGPCIDIDPLVIIKWVDALKQRSASQLH